MSEPDLKIKLCPLDALTVRVPNTCSDKQARIIEGEHGRIALAGLARLLARLAARDWSSSQ